jgi:NhaA family Na+:H+ antiporter
LRVEVWCARDTRRRCYRICRAARRSKEGQEGALEDLQHRLSPWVSFLLLPVFAFANAGMSLAGISAADLVSPIPLGNALGLLLGKALGIYGASRALIAGGFGEMPAGASQMQLFDTAVLGGIGFTMSLFIGMLAFPEPEASAQVRVGVLAGSLLSAIVGYILLVRRRSA